MLYYVGEIRLFATPKLPEYWAYCDGAKLSISEYQALYATIGTQYGGDGRSNFCLPNLTGRAVLGAGSFLPQHDHTSKLPIIYQVGQMYGAPTVTVSKSTQIPAHTHLVQAAVATVPPYLAMNAMASELHELGRMTRVNPKGQTQPGLLLSAYASEDQLAGGASLDPRSVTSWPPSGNAPLPHENRQPYIALNYAICVTVPSGVQG